MNLAIILSAGIGSRMQTNLPKQFIEINNKPLFIYTLEKFNIDEINQIILVINQDYKDVYITYLNKFPINKDIKLVIGGLTRQESVNNALQEISCDDFDIVLIHDGARPLIEKNTIINNIETCKIFKTPVITITNIVDTIIDKDYNLLDRNKLLSVQTPQTFMFYQINKLHQKALKDNLINISDDGQLAKKYGLNIKYVNGSRLNFKVTEKDDIKLFELLLKEGEK